MTAKCFVEIEFPDRPLQSELTKGLEYLGELVEKNYAYPYNLEGIVTLGFGDSAIQVKYKITLQEDSG